MRVWLLLLSLSVASADDDAAAVNSGEWGVGLFLQFDNKGSGAWAGSKAGAVARFETVLTSSTPYVDSLGHVTMREDRTVALQEETRVVTPLDGGRLRIETRLRHFEGGTPGEWERPSASELRVAEIEDFKVERLGDTTYKIESRTVAATTYRLSGPQDEIWTVAVNGKLGVLHAKQEGGDRIEWSLLRTDVKAGVFGHRCREYKLQWKPPVEFEEATVRERHLFLSTKVPGRVVRRTYTSPLKTKVEENLILYQGR